MDDVQRRDMLSHWAAIKQRFDTDPRAYQVTGGEWSFLQASESKLIELMSGGRPPDAAPGDVEYGLILYMMQNHLPKLVVDALEYFGMPSTQITAEMMSAWEQNLKQGAGVVASDGTLVSDVTYAAFDPNWAMACGYYILSRYTDEIPAATFQTNPATISIDDSDSLTIALISDWGTGIWTDGASALCPSQLVQQSVAQLAPDIIIHLGDVYYSGTQNEEQSNLLPNWSNKPKYFFTLNSNHEMYDGANGYFGALDNDLFASQQKTSYFSISFKNWLIFGLDSAFYDQSTLYTAGTITDQNQINFINTVLAQPGNAGKQIIVLTHHNAIAYDGSDVNVRAQGESLLNDVQTALGNRAPDFWYYGHIHNGVAYDYSVYKELNASGHLPAGSSGQTLFRCFGNGAIPYGAGYGFTADNVGSGIDYYAHTSMGSDDPRQQLRILNGFATLTLSENTIVEQALEVQNSNTGSAKFDVRWTRSTTFAPTS